MYKNNAIFSSDVKMSYYEKEQCPQQDVCAKAGQTGNKLNRIIINIVDFLFLRSMLTTKRHTDIGNDKTLFGYRALSIRHPCYNKLHCLLPLTRFRRGKRVCDHSGRGQLRPTVHYLRPLPRGPGAGHPHQETSR